MTPWFHQSNTQDTLEFLCEICESKNINFEDPAALVYVKNCIASKGWHLVEYNKNDTFSAEIICGNDKFYAEDKSRELALFLCFIDALSFDEYNN